MIPGDFMGAQPYPNQRISTANSDELKAAQQQIAETETAAETYRAQLMACRDELTTLRHTYQRRERGFMLQLGAVLGAEVDSVISGIQALAKQHRNLTHRLNRLTICAREVIEAEQSGTKGDMCVALCGLLGVLNGAPDDDEIAQAIDQQKRITELAAQNARLREGIEEAAVARTKVEACTIAEKYLHESPTVSIAEIEIQSVEQFKNELIESVKAIYRPHIEGVCAVVTGRLRQISITNPAETQPLVMGASNKQEPISQTLTAKLANIKGRDFTKVNDPIAIGQALRDARLSINHTQGDMADLFGIRVSKWSAVENAKSTANPSRKEPQP